MDNHFLSTLGLARRAGKLLLGVDSVREYRKSAALLIYASDASPRVERVLADRKDPAIRVLHNVDDPILSEKDKRFLMNTLGGKITWFDCGGHLGNLFVKEHQECFLESFSVKKK